MKGMELAKAFYYEAGRPALREAFPDLAGKWAAGLAGEGSDCFGFDDEISRDHDWGPGFCLWLTREQYRLYGEKLQQVYDRLPREFRGYRRMNTAAAGKRVGVLCAEDFYVRFIGLERAPETLMEWLRIPEAYLAAAVNGEVFEDGTGVFSKVREKLLGFYPEDVRRKKIAARLAVMTREGQYNYPRCRKRGDAAAALQALSRFLDASVSVMYLLKGGYAPYYKWAVRGLERWPECGRYAALLQKLAEEQKEEIVEEIAGEVIWELRMQGLSNAEGDFLQDHGAYVMSRIKDLQIRKLHILEG